MYGYSSLLRCALILGIASGVLAASLQSLSTLPEDALFFRSHEKSPPFPSSRAAGRSSLIWRTAGEENCVLNVRAASDHLAFRLAERCEGEGGVLVGLSELPQSPHGVCRAVADCKLPLSGS